jgi:Sigma-70 region 2
VPAPADLEAFCVRVYPRLVGALRLYCGSLELAQELTQDTLVRVCANWEQVANMERPEAWTHRVAINLANSRFRRHAAGRRIASRDRIEPLVTHHDHFVEARLDLERTLAVLPRRQRAVMCSVTTSTCRPTRWPGFSRSLPGPCGCWLSGPGRRLPSSSTPIPEIGTTCRPPRRTAMPIDFHRLMAEPVQPTPLDVDSLWRRGRRRRIRVHLLRGVVVLAVLAGVGLGLTFSPLVSGTRIRPPVSPSNSTLVAPPAATTTTTSVPVSSSVPSSVPVTTRPAPRVAATPTTTTPSLAVCRVSQFVATATSDEGSYAPGQTVNITINVRDTSPDPCSDSTNLILQGGCIPTPGWSSEWRGSASAINGSGQVVWDFGAGPTAGGIQSCPVGVYLPTVPGNFSASVVLSWPQDVCTDAPPSTEGPTTVPNPNCPGTPVPAGTYRIMSSWEEFQAPPVSITIESW